MELIFVGMMCSSQSFSSTACHSAFGAYWEEIHGQKVVDKVINEHINPYVNQMPSIVKSSGALGYALYTKHMRIGLYKGVSYDIREDQININGQTKTSVVNYLSYSRSF